jgi:hypothetical protein
MNLDRTFTLWSNNPAQPTVATPYIHSLYLFMHEARHNEVGDPGHTSCTAWTGATGTPNGMDAQFDPGSGFTRAALYLMWIYKYGRYDPRRSARRRRTSLRPSRIASAPARRARTPW